MNIRRLVVVCLFAVVSLLPIKSEARDFPWTGAQFFNIVGGDYEVNKEVVPVSLSAFVMDLWNPEAGWNIVYGYFGIKLQPAPWVIIRPYLGFNHGLATDTSDMLMASLWLEFDPIPEFRMNLQGDLNWNKGETIYYGYYSMDYQPKDFLNVGVQVEQTRRIVTFGPHIGFTKNFWHLELQYHAGVQDECYGQSVRVVNVLAF